MHDSLLLLVILHYSQWRCNLSGIRKDFAVLLKRNIDIPHYNCSDFWRDLLGSSCSLLWSGLVLTLSARYNDRHFSHFLRFLTAIWLWNFAVIFWHFAVGWGDAGREPETANDLCLLCTDHSLHPTQVVTRGFLFCVLFLSLWYVWSYLYPYSRCRLFLYFIFEVFRVSKYFKRQTVCPSNVLLCMGAAETEPRYILYVPATCRGCVIIHTDLRVEHDRANWT